MKIEFARTGERRYAVRTKLEGQPLLHMDPAPGFEPDLPHDLVHYVVEDKLGLAFGVFGQVAAGGDAGSFYLGAAGDSARDTKKWRRRIQQRGERLAREGRQDSAFSERAAAICQYEWLARSSEPSRRQRAEKLEPYIDHLWELCSETEREQLTETVRRSILDRFDELSVRWSSLSVGESMTLPWCGPQVRAVRAKCRS